jgi:hypothetical protein
MRYVPVSGPLMRVVFGVALKMTPAHAAARLNAGAEWQQCHQCHQPGATILSPPK